MDGDSDNSTGVYSSLAGWAKQPFSSKMDLVHWTLFTGLILILIWFWSRVLKHIVE